MPYREGDPEAGASFWVQSLARQGEQGEGTQKQVVKRLQKGWFDVAARVFSADSCPCRRIFLTRHRSGHNLSD
jgi:hypothetical protein